MTHDVWTFLLGNVSDMSASPLSKAKDREMYLILYKVAKMSERITLASFRETRG